ncbi:dipeptide epimerase [Flavobacterium selenitireducens]|uniref:dipeptide epimerase n=1 Tax=Flavobacterium selenitireducens TaxID=2722704 RepID=UPI00168BF648|nr:dipeptide epimerase [Flavobacterium selenitireducens]MBD3582686.1 dipeptide epimerase [Flavobacterium selenitireducens]
MPLTLSYRFFDLPLRHKFEISRYSVSVQKTVVAIVSDGEISGYGEATANPYYNSTREKLGESIAKAIPIIASAGETHPEMLWPKLESVLFDDYFALCAVDVAYWDYYARKHGRTLRSFWSNGSEPLPSTSYTIGIAPIEEMKAKIAEFPWPIYKIKLGTQNDLEIVETLRKCTDSPFRVDANAAWSVKQAIAYSKILGDLQVEFIEQPLAASDIDGMKRLKSESHLPCLADESCQRETDVLPCSQQFHGINIKLMKCGGITPARRMIANARELGLSVMAGCMTESTFGISALAQLAPLLDFIDCDGALLLASDIASGASFEYGKITFGENVGSGAKPLLF